MYAYITSRTTSAYAITRAYKNTHVYPVYTKIIKGDSLWLANEKNELEWINPALVELT